MDESQESPGNNDIAVCLVEDEADLRAAMVETLGHHGFDVRGFSESRELYFGLLQQPCEIVVLDVGLPGEDGFSIMERLRATARLGIIMLTARDQTMDRVRALMGGADIYLVKPVDIDELAANIISLSRRLRASEPMRASGTGWRMSPDGWMLLSPAGVAVSLSGMERSLMQTLMQHAGATVARESLASALGHHPDDVVTNRLDMLVSRLRRKVLQATGEKLSVNAVRGVGFSLPTSFMADKP